MISVEIDFASLEPEPTWRLDLFDGERWALTPPPDLTVSQWADERRILQPGTSRQAGPWRTETTPYLREPMDAYNDPQIRHLVLCFGTQLGKALDAETPIPTPEGWVPMAELKPGNSVFDENGNICLVTFATQIMYGRECFEIEFSDGAKIICDADHLWTVSDEYDYRRIKRVTITAGEIAKTFDKHKGRQKRNRYAIQTTRALNLPEVDLTIDPYVLGVWLGDGNSYSGQVTLHRKDLEIADYIKNAGHKVIIRQIEKRNRSTHNLLIDPVAVEYRRFCRRGHDTWEYGRRANGYCRKCASQFASRYRYGKIIDSVVEPHDSLTVKLRALGLIGNKHIPSQYLRAAKRQRLALLQGLMDTDGYCNADGGHLEFSTTSKALADGFGELLASLGIKYAQKAKQPQCEYNGHKVNGKLAYRFSFLEYRETPIFRLLRKLGRMKSEGGATRTTETRRRRIVSARRVDSRPVKCISVDSESKLYLAGRAMIPTHNTETLYNILGYVIDHEPYSTLLVYPREEDGKTISRARVQPMVEECPTLAAKIPERQELYQLCEQY